MSTLGSTLLWAAYVAAVGLLCALAAWVVEPIARALRWPTRWLWTLALVAQLAAVLVAVGAPGGAGPAAWFTRLWIAASAVAVVVYLRAVRALRRERGEWRVTVAEAMPVWVSERTGPAVVGFLRSLVVAPGWAMALAERERRMLLRHEAEHVAAWDPTLLLAGLATCAALPWSPAAWWALGRLRLAIEVDCDRRVLAAEPDVAAYGELLVAVQGRVVPGAAGLAAFAERRLPLEERIEAMTARRPRGALLRWSARGAIAGVLVLAACMAPRPAARLTSSVAGDPLLSVRADSMRVRFNRDGSQTITSKPNATPPQRVMPTINHRLLGQAIRSHFARPDVADPALKTIVYLLIDAGGRVIGDVREPRGDRPDDSHSVDVTPEVIRRVFPALPPDAPRHSGIADAASIGLRDVDATIVYEYLQPEEDPQNAATRRAIAQLFAERGGAPRDTAVSVVAAFGTAWRLIEVRRVPVADVPTFTGVRPSVRERLLPSLRGREVGIEGITTGRSQWGLADGSVVHVWKLEDPRTRLHLSRSWIQERVGEALDRYFARAPRPVGTVTAWVLLDPAGRALEIVVRDAPPGSVSLDTVRAHLTLARGRQLEGFGHLEGEPYGLQPASRIVWALEMKLEDVRRRRLPERPPTESPRLR